MNYLLVGLFQNSKMWLVYLSDFLSPGSMSEREALCSIATSTCNISYFLQNRIKEPADHTILKAGMMARRKVKVISSASNGDS